LKIIDGWIFFDLIIDPILDFEDWEPYSDGDTTIAGSVWTNDAGDNCDWQTDSGGTPSSNTGPSVDHTLGTSGGEYFYMEVSSGWCQTPNPGSSASFSTSDTYDSDTNSYNVSFWYHMYGSTIGTLYFEVYNGTWNTEWSLTGAQGDTWYQANVNLDSYSGDISFRFRGVQDGQYYSDFALDDINITYYVRSLPVTANAIECEESSTWKDCSEVDFGETITRLRVNCTAGGGPITNASFNLQNVPDSTTFFSANATSNTTDYWIYDNSDLTINDSGQFSLNAVCYDEGSSAYSDSNWTVPWGVLNADLIGIIGNAKNVSQNYTFEFTSQLTCSGGECGFVNVTLDPPADWWNVSYTKRKEINLSNSGSALDDFPAYLEIDYEESMQSDYDDLRFMDESCGTNGSLLDYEIEYYNSSKAGF
jgi:hypothetical protein